MVRPGGRQTDYELDGAGNVLEERHHDGRTSRFAYDGDSLLLRAENEETKVAFKRDAAGNVLEELHHDGRTSRFAYDGDGLLLRAENAEIKVAFKRDAAGRVIKEMQGGQDIVRPDDKEVSFAYDALGRRICKTYAGTTTHFVWDGNVPLHEWTETAESEESEMVTWLFEQDTFVPAAKLVANGECFSIISDYLGTPLQAYDKQGLGTRAGHLRAAKETAILVHSI